MESSDDLLLFYGARLDAAGLERTLDHVLQNNLRRQEAGEGATPFCIWGTHGVGKTMMVERYAQARGWKFAYVAPAQFEEMGDLHGLPKLSDRGDAGEVTVFAPPDWVPREEGPGILLLDDLNRADDRILRGLMQLLQNFGMFSWSLPPKWQIVVTANPEGGDYSVTPMDDAMLTRMLHATLVFDVKRWAAWARSEGVDPRGIDFALSYPEVLVGKRTTPRSLTQFFEQISGIDDLRAEAELVQTLAEGSLDELTVSTFMSFVHDGLALLVDPAEILADLGAVSERIDALARGEAGTRRVDRLATMCTRLLLEVERAPDALDEAGLANLVAFLQHDALPNDLRMSLHRDLVAGPGKRAPKLKKALADKSLAKLMLGKG